MTERVSFGILGPLKVVGAGRELSIRPAKQRALLATLLLGRGRAVSVTGLVDALWGPTPPATADHLIQVYVSDIRTRLREIGLDDRLLTESPGYRLTVLDGELDAARFEALLSDPERPVETLREALGICRGDVLADVSLEGDAALEARRLEDLRLSANERLLEAELDAGESARVVPELEHLSSQHPYRERLTWLLMLALYRSGRQADALARYRETRRKLVEELGVEPGPALRDLENAILRHDPSLEPPAAAGETRRAHQRRRVWYGLAAGATATGAALALALIGFGSPSSVASPHISPGSVAVVDEARNQVVAAHRIGDAPGPVVKAGSVLAVGDPDDRTLELVNPSTLTIERSVGLPESPRTIGASGSLVWIGYAYSGRIGWYDLRSGFLSQEFRPTARARGLAAIVPTTGKIWVSTRDGALVALSPTSLKVLAASAAGHFTMLALGGASLWGIGFFSGDVSRMALPSGGLRSKTPLTGEAQSIAPGDAAIWVTTTAPARLYRLDQETGQVPWFVPLGGDPGDVAVGTRAIWVASGRTLLRIDPSKRQLASTIDIGRPISAIAADGRGRLLITTG